MFRVEVLIIFYLYPTPLQLFSTNFAFSCTFFMVKCLMPTDLMLMS